MNSIRSFISEGGNVLVMLGEGGESNFNTNINFLLEEYGIMVNNGKSFLTCANLDFFPHGLSEE